MLSAPVRSLPLALAFAAGLVACGGGAAPPVPAQSPLDWLDVAGMWCADGSPTGLGLAGGRPDAVLVFLAGGGACWSETSCARRLPASPRAFGRSQMDALRLQAKDTILDRTLPGNPFADWTFVYVPYCTGDVHAGDAVRVHGGVTWEHHGYRNLEAAVAALGAALPRPAEVVVAGSSAGGFGALAAYDLVRDVWDPAGGTSAALLDDSGPTLVGTAMPPQLLSTWWDVWGLASTIGVACPACASDLSELWPGLAARHPADRLALLTTTRDDTILAFLSDPDLAVTAMSPLELEAAVALLAAKLGAMGASVASYRVGDPDAYRHALLVGEPFFLPGVGGAPVLDWVGRMVSGQAWTSAGP
jgi:hypothetical protein